MYKNSAIGSSISILSVLSGLIVIGLVFKVLL